MILVNWNEVHHTQINLIRLVLQTDSTSLFYPSLSFVTYSLQCCMPYDWVCSAFSRLSFCYLLSGSIKFWRGVCHQFELFFLLTERRPYKYQTTAGSKKWEVNLNFCRLGRLCQLFLHTFNAKAMSAFMQLHDIHLAFVPKKKQRQIYSVGVCHNGLTWI